MLVDVSKKIFVVNSIFDVCWLLCLLLLYWFRRFRHLNQFPTLDDVYFDCEKELQVLSISLDEDLNVMKIRLREFQWLKNLYSIFFQQLINVTIV